MKVSTSKFYCTKCGRETIPLPRKLGSQKEPGHLKKIFCMYCEEQVNAAEIREQGTKYTAEDFNIEFENGNFVDGQRILPYKQFIHLHRTNPEKLGEIVNANN